MQHSCPCSIALSGEDEPSWAREASGSVCDSLHAAAAIKGVVLPLTIQMVQALLARNNQQLMRSMRTGGAFAT